MAKRGRPRKVQFELERDSAQSIAAVVVLLVSLLTLLSFFGQAAGFGSILQQLLNRFFGWGSALIPLVLFFSGLILLRRFKSRFFSPRVLTGLVLFLFSFLGLAHFFFPAGTAKDEAFNGQGGGIAGFIIQRFLKQGLGPFGGVLVLVALLLVAILVVFNASLDETLVNLGKIFGALGNFFSRYVFRGTLGLFGRKSTAETNETVAEAADSGEEAVTVEPLAEKPAGEVEIVRSSYAPASQKMEKEREDLRQETVANVPLKTTAWRYPPLDLLEDVAIHEEDQEEIKKNAQIIEDSLQSFGIKTQVTEINVGPTVTQYALEAASGTKLAKITTLQRDLAMALASTTGSVRIEAPIPGRSLVGIEVPNKVASLVSLKSLLTSEKMQTAKSSLVVALGQDVAGKAAVADLAKMPHVLVAGATGSGKSILIHTFIMSILFRTTPEEVRLILADPKRVELSIYAGIPHLLTPVIVETEKILPSLKWSVTEMERRYRLFQNAGAKDIESFNELSGFQALPYIIIVVDELADLMATAANDVEKVIVRLAQMSRATGLHLVLSTQRPSTDVLTGLIKANIPCRIALNTTSGVDSRVIIDRPGAEKLLGRGDMLYLPPDASSPKRIQGVYVSPSEIKALVKFLKEENQAAEATAENSAMGAPPVLADLGPDGPADSGPDFDDALFPEAVELICRHRQGSSSLLQRRFSIGYARAARLLDTLEARGVVGPKDGSKPREVLIADPSEVLGSHPSQAPQTPPSPI